MQNNEILALPCEYGTGNKRRTASQSKPVQALDPETGEVVMEFASVREAGRNGFTPIAISRCCRGINVDTIGV